MKASFTTQVLAVCGILAVGALCFPMPGGGLLINRLTGYNPHGDDVRQAESEVRSVPVMAVPVAVAPEINVAPQNAASAVSRFKADAEVTVDTEGATTGWTAGNVGGKTVWQDNQSGMIWGARLALTLSSFTADDLQKAKNACAGEAPNGAWALPTAAEFDIAKVNGILNMDGDARHRWISYQVVPPGIEMPSGRGYVSVAAEKDFSVRCVARSKRAPSNGYMEAGNEITLKAMAE